jgi:hypothetical protein
MLSQHAGSSASMMSSACPISHGQMPPHVERVARGIDQEAIQSSLPVVAKCHHRHSE